MNNYDLYFVLAIRQDGLDRHYPKVPSRIMMAGTAEHKQEILNESTYRKHILNVHTNPRIGGPNMRTT